MVEAEHNIIIEHLRAIRSDMDDLKTGQKQILNRIGTVEGHIAVIVSSDANRGSDLDTLRQRIERIEARLELRDMH